MSKLKKKKHNEFDEWLREFNRTLKIQIYLGKYHKMRDSEKFQSNFRPYLNMVLDLERRGELNSIKVEAFILLQGERIAHLAMKNENI